MMEKQKCNELNVRLGNCALAQCHVLAHLVSGKFGIDFGGSRTLSEWWLLQMFEAHVHLSQGKSSPQAKKMDLCDPDLGLLGDAKGNTWKGCER